VRVSNSLCGNHLYIDRERASASCVELARLWREQITIETEGQSKRNSARPRAPAMRQPTRIAWRT